MSYDIAACGKRCARTGESLPPGQRYMAVLFERDGRLIREDVSMAAWAEPPADAFAWWQTRVPEDGPTKPAVIDDGLVHDCFIRLEGDADPQKANFRYVLALWLLRKRKLKFEEVQRESGQDWLLLRESKSRQIHRVLDPRLDEEAIRQAQDEVEAMLRAA